MLNGVQAGAFGEHPAGENRLPRAVGFDLIDGDETCGLRFLGDGTRHAGMWLDDEATEPPLFVDGDLERGGDAGDLVQACEDSNRIGDAFGMGWRNRQHQDA